MINTIQLDNRFGDFVVVDVEEVSPGFFKLYYNEVQQGGVFNDKTQGGYLKFKSFIEKAFLPEEVEQILSLKNE